MADTAVKTLELASSGFALSQRECSVMAAVVVVVVVVGGA